MAVIQDHNTRKQFGKPGIAAFMTFATASHWRAIAVLVAVSFAAFLPGFLQIPPVDRDEARFAQATKQMIETGNYIDIRFQDETRYKKPVGIYWLQAAVVELRGSRRRTAGTAPHRPLPHTFADRRDRRRRTDLLGRARIGLATGGIPCRRNDSYLDPAWRRGAARQDRCDVAHDRGGRDGGDGARLSRREGRARRVHPSARGRGRVLDGDGRRHPAQGSGQSLGNRACRNRACCHRSLGQLDLASAAGDRHSLDVAAHDAVVSRHLFPQRRRFLRRCDR